MNQLTSKHITCPYCGELIEIIVDCSIPYQYYIEDCEVCCRPVSLSVSVNENGQISVFPKHENEI